MRYTLRLAITIVVALGPAAAHAQTDAANPPAPHQQILSTNPLGLLANWFNGEYERKIGPATTVGIAASTWDAVDYKGGSLFLRWYPQGEALAGFYVGARAGAYHFEMYPRGKSALPGVGLEVGHNWLFGPHRNASVGIGFGVTRLFRNSGDGDGPIILPNVRLVNFGIAF